MTIIGTINNKPSDLNTCLRKENPNISFGLHEKLGESPPPPPPPPTPPPGPRTPFSP